MMGWGQQLMEKANTESSRARDAHKTAGQRCSANSRIIVYVKFEKVYKKEVVVIFMILTHRTQENV
jgi:acyl-CoA reductase-like NAD-dependent aldehyde dehydrogenase